MKKLILLFFFPFLFGGDDEYTIKMVSLPDDGFDVCGTMKLGNGLVFTFWHLEGQNSLFTHQQRLYYIAIQKDSLLSDTIRIQFNLEKEQYPEKDQLVTPVLSGDYSDATDEFFFTCFYSRLKYRYSSITSFNHFTYRIGYGKLVEGKVSEIKILPFNERDINYYQPTISADGNTLIFVSDLNGVANLYSSKRNKYKDTWSEPKLIEELESEFPSSSPKLINDSLLVFAVMDTITGKGGLDIYRSEKINGVWTFPENWEELNSEFNDYGVEMIDENSGYFSSTRDSSNAKLYYFEKIKK